MSWHTHYFDDEAGEVARAIDSLPYHAPLLLYPSEKAALCSARLANLNAALNSERARPQEVLSDPYHLVLDVADICNLRCPLCVQATEPRGRRRTTMSLSTAAAALRAFPTGLLRVELFSWGEPLLNSNFCDIVRYADSAQIFSRTSSHFSLSKTPDMAALVDSGLKWLVLSIDGVTQPTYQKYRVGGDLDLVLSNLKSLVAAKRACKAVFPIVEWQFLALRHNRHEIERARDLAREMHVDVFRYGGARGQMANRIRISARENFEQSKEFLLENTDPLSEYRADGERLHEHEAHGCRWLWGKMAVHADGGVSPCWTSWERKADFGSIGDRSPDQFWRSEVFSLARAAAKGAQGILGPAQICERCALHKAFVNAPEALVTPPSRRQVQGCAEVFRRSNLTIDATVQRTVEASCAF